MKHKTFVILLFFCCLCSSCQNHRRSDQKELLERLEHLEKEEGWRVLLRDGGVQYLFDIRTGSRIPVYLLPQDEIRIGDASSLGMASFSPDGKKITFAENRGHERALIVFDLTERKKEVLLILPYLEAARWSPTGEGIAFQGRKDQTGDCSLYVYSLTNKTLTLIVDQAVEPGEFLFGWGRQGKSIVYQDSDHYVWTADLETKIVRKLDKGRFPTWSPNGKYIAYGVDSAGDPGYIVYEFQTGKKESILTGKGAHRSLIWSPDSRYLLYSSVSRGFLEYVLALFGEEHYGDLFVIDVRSKAQVKAYSGGSIYPTDWAKTSALR